MVLLIIGVFLFGSKLFKTYLSSPRLADYSRRVSCFFEIPVVLITRISHIFALHLHTQVLSCGAIGIGLVSPISEVFMHQRHCGTFSL